MRRGLRVVRAGHRRRRRNGRVRRPGAHATRRPQAGDHRADQREQCLNERQCKCD